MLIFFYKLIIFSINNLTIEKDKTKCYNKKRERIIMRRFKGFTLTELMVALAVIGILVAVVTPAIMKNRPNKNKMMVKKSFYTAEQIVSTLINDESLYPDMRDFCVGSEVAEDAEEEGICAWGFDYTAEVQHEGYSYDGKYKFAALFKEKLNVKGNDNASKDTTDKTGIEAEGSNKAFYPAFYTSDGIKWDLTGTKDAWKAEKDKVGTFDTECKASPENAGCGVIKIDVDTSNGEEVLCTEANDDCDTYEIQLLASGKMRINPAHTRAVNYATINTSIKDE